MVTSSRKSCYMNAVVVSVCMSRVEKHDPERLAGGLGATTSGTLGVASRRWSSLRAADNPEPVRGPVPKPVGYCFWL